MVLVMHEVFSKSIIDEEVLCSLHNNRKVVGFIHYKDTVEVVSTGSRDNILYYFLNYNIRSQSMILVKSCSF